MGGGSSRGSGWTSFDLDVLAEPTANENERGEEVAQPNPPNALDNPVAYPGEAQEALPQAPAQAEGAQPDAPYPYQKNEIIGGVWNPLSGGFWGDSPLLPPMRSQWPGLRPKTSSRSRWRSSSRWQSLIQVAIGRDGERGPWTIPVRPQGNLP